MPNDTPGTEAAMSEDTPGTETAAQAYAELAATLAEIEAKYIGPERGMHSASERAAGRYLVANALQHGFQCWFPSDPKRPLFQRWLGMTKKLLGDNPDAVYYGAVADPAGSYRIRGNVHGACYTSFSVEAGAQDGPAVEGRDLDAQRRRSSTSPPTGASRSSPARSPASPATGCDSSPTPAASRRATTGSGPATSRPTPHSTSRS